MAKESEKFMRIAIDLALRAKPFPLPNPSVGAVIVKGGRILGRGYHKRAGEPHAEVLAIEDSGKEVSGATLYVTLEPCDHYGRTPPCTELIIEKGIKKVVVGIVDPNPLVNGKGIRRLKKAGIDVEVGVLKEECEKLNAVYIKNITQKRPYLIYKSALTADGRTATVTGDSKWITSKESRDRVHRLRAEVEGVMVGIETVLKDDPSLTTHGKGDREPLRIIVDSRLRIPMTARLLNDRYRDRTLIATTINAPRQRLNRLRSKGIRVLQVGAINSRVNLRELLEKIYKEGVYRLLVEGGATLGGALLKEGLIDRVVFFIAPKVIGNGRGVFEGFGVSSLKEANILKDVIIHKVGKDIVIEGVL